MYRETVDTATSMPSLASSLRMRGAPQVERLDLSRVVRWCIDKALRLKAPKE